MVAGESTDAVEEMKVRFYQKTGGAVVIPGSEPGIYVDLLEKKQ